MNTSSNDGTSDWQDTGSQAGYIPKRATTHRPWCTDHLSEDPADPLTAGADSCVATVDVVEPGNGWRGVHVTVSQDRGQAEPVVMVESSQPMTVDEAERLCADLRGLLDRVMGTAR